ncbi:cell filamentation protein Fic [Oceanisphaera profunda]|uniref:Cell filamentation protein Fic n=1 Tax=Oceanisphaera profunda TaxID=1416627 RepID=A0A1Y0D7C6_9GAMM|nr:Fic family protein [Oceanisphaera profunda]ART83453.1 cell filamentation protein Fic [Oceanisphaera profunda]
MAYSPQFQLSHTMMRLVAEISEYIGQWSASNQGALVPQLRKENRIRTIQASLAVEQNTLTLEQVTAVIAGKTVLGAPKDIQEVHNAFAAYEAMPKWQPSNGDDLLSAHRILMQGLVLDAGQWRSTGAGIYRGEQLVHMAPPASQVSRLMAQLLAWLNSTDAHPLIASCAFDYELEFIHPFSDGKGRMGRLWQTLILSHWQPLLAYLPVETVIKDQQQAYYQAFRQADLSSDCSGFIEFLLDALATALKEAIAIEQKTQVQMQVKTQVENQADMQQATPVVRSVKTPEQILALLSAQPELTLAEVAAHVGRAVSTIERAAAKLKQQGRLSYQGPKKGGHWQVH